MLSNIPLMFFLTVIVAPILEEAIFRGFLGSLVEKSYFKWLYYLSAILFGLVHASNYELTESQNLLIPLIILPQLFLGFMLGYIRVRYGFFMACFFMRFIITIVRNLYQGIDLINWGHLYRE